LLKVDAEFKLDFHDIIPIFVFAKFYYATLQKMPGK